MIRKHPHSPIICLAAGGSGGHVMPAVALAQEILKTHTSLMLLTDPRAEAFWPQSLREFLHVIPCANLRKRGVLQKVFALWQFCKAFFVTWFLFNKMRPSLVVGFGGYPSAMPLLVATLKKIGVVLFELDRRIGFVNRLFMKRARLKLSANKLSDKTFMHSGLPARHDIDDLYNRDYVAPSFSRSFNLLVFGGSQGAQILNTMMPHALSLISEDLRTRFHVTQQVSPQYAEELKNTYQKLSIACTLRAFFPDMAVQLSQAHLVISRCGASTLAELSLAKKPAILIPFPHAADNHQVSNALPYHKDGAAWMIEEKDITPQSLADLIERLANDDATLMEASTKMASFAKPKAAKQALQEILSAIKES